MHLQLLEFYVGVTETSHPLWLNKHSLWSRISFLSIYTMRRSFDFPIRSQQTSLGMCSEVLPRPDTPPWVALIIYTVGFYFEKRMCWFNQDIAVVSKRDQKGNAEWPGAYFILGFLGGYRYHDRLFFLYCMKIPGRESCQIWQTWCARFFPFYYTHSWKSPVSKIFKHQLFNLTTI